QRFPHLRIERCVGDEVPRIVFQDALCNALPVQGSRLFQGKKLLYQDRYPLPDRCLCLLQSDRRKTVWTYGIIDGCADISGGVDKRAIKIKNDEVDCHPIM